MLGCVVLRHSSSNETGGDNSNKRCFGTKPKLFQESGDFSRNRKHAIIPGHCIKNRDISGIFISRFLWFKQTNQKHILLGEHTVGFHICYICGSKDCLRSFADIKHKHTGMVEDLKTESLKGRQYIVYRNMRVKSGAVDIMVNGKQSMNTVQSSQRTGLSFTSDRMCYRCRDILREPDMQIAFHFLCLQENGVSKNKSNNVQEILNSIEEKGIYCVENHPGKEIILCCAELYCEEKLTEDDFFHKIQHLMIEAG